MTSCSPALTEKLSLSRDPVSFIEEGWVVSGLVPVLAPCRVPACSEHPPVGPPGPPVRHSVRPGSVGWREIQTGWRTAFPAKTSADWRCWSSFQGNDEHSMPNLKNLEMKKWNWSHLNYYLLFISNDFQKIWYDLIWFFSGFSPNSFQLAETKHTRIEYF